jgi:hypothetical protein
VDAFKQGYCISSRHFLASILWFVHNIKLIEVQDICIYIYMKLEGSIKNNW